MRFFSDLRNHLIKAYPDQYICGHIYQGYLDFSYFSFTPTEIKQSQLKVGICLLHKALRFEVWLVGQNKKVQQRYWQLFKGSDWEDSIIPTTPSEAVLKKIIAENPDFDQPERLTRLIATETLAFINNLKRVLFPS